MVRFGCCANVDAMPKLAAWGFDYVELPVSAVMPESPDEEYQPQQDKIRAGRITPEAYNCFLPGDLKIVGPQIDSARVERYLEKAVRRMSALGGKIAVVGSAGARAVPAGFAEEEARRQLVDFFRLAGAIAKDWGMAIAIEPLNKGESNIINSTLEARDLARAINHTHVGVLADNYHMIVEKEPYANLVVVADYLTHIHLSTPERMAPGIGDHRFNDVFAALKEGDYRQRISIECGYKDFETDAPRALDLLRQEWEKAQ
jgi:D-psicose/D-tagatose/L-ribulose 3-epimerase